MKPAEASFRPAWAEVDLSAIAHNASVLAAMVSPAEMCAVVKAGGYGHGAVEVARAALQGGAARLAVALVEEGCELRRAGIDAPVLILSEPPLDSMPQVVEAALTPTIYTRAGLDAVSAAAAAGAATARSGQPLPVHVKVDTGMHRVGAAPARAVQLAAAVAADPHLELEGFWTHFAVADEPDNPYTAGQLAAFERASEDLARTGVRPALRHAANSGGALFHPGAHFDMVRCGISLYGLAPAEVGGIDVDLRPAMSLKARVSFVKTLGAGERISYGLRYRLERDSVIATVPLGYADGVTRSLSARGGHVLIGGRRCPMAGTVTMDQLMVDCGPGADVAAGDEAVLIGSQGDEVITAWDWARATGTIAYEVVCGIGARVPRRYLR